MILILRKEEESLITNLEQVLTPYSPADVSSAFNLPPLWESYILYITSKYTSKYTRSKYFVHVYLPMLAATKTTHAQGQRFALG